jgi:hypothetical protein
VRRGEQFIAVKPNQRFVDVAHRMRAHRQRDAEAFARL